MSASEAVFGDAIDWSMCMNNAARAANMHALVLKQLRECEERVTQAAETLRCAIEAGKTAGLTAADVTVEGISEKVRERMMLKQAITAPNGECCSGMHVPACPAQA